MKQLERTGRVAEPTSEPTFAESPVAKAGHVAAAILHELGTTQIRLLSNNPAKTEGLADLGIDVVEQVPLTGDVTPENIRYLETKRERMAHTVGAIGEETA